MYAYNPEQVRTQIQPAAAARGRELSWPGWWVWTCPSTTTSPAITAFTHKAGIHAKAILNNPSTYEILDPADFGLTRYIHVAHRLTGWNAIKERAEQLQLNLSDDEIKKITAQIKSLADQKRSPSTMSISCCASITAQWWTPKWSNRSSRLKAEASQA